MSAIIVLAVLIAVYTLWGMLHRRFALKGLVCSRAFSKPAAFVGEEAELIEIVRNDRPMLIPWLRVESRVSPYLRLGRQENLHVSGDMYYCSLFTLMPYQQIRRRHRVKFLRRGVYDLGGASLTAGDLLGMFEVTRDQQMSAPVLVYPRLLDERDVPAPLARMVEATVSRRHLLTDPFLVRGIRPYQIGDPVRDIHWPATARTGEAQVRLHDYTAQLKLLVIFNAERKEGQWGDTLMDYEQEEIERMISVAATVCIQALRAGLPVGFATNMPQGRGKESTVLLPSGGAAREEELLAAFARLTVVRTLAFPLFLGSLEEVSGLDLMVISCFDSEEIQSALARLRQRNNVQLCVLEPEGGAAA